MSCTSCQSKFSFFTRENGCPKCGFSYCSKCLKYKCQLPDNTVKKVCGPCYHKKMSQSGESSGAGSDGLPTPEEDSVPLATVDIERKLEALENPVKPPIVIYKQDHWEEFKTGLEPEDQAIVERLKKLKEADKKPPPVTTEEIRRRLALLKDEDPDYKPPLNVCKVDTRSDQEKSDDLIREYMERLELSKHDAQTDDDIERRLNKLKGMDPSKSTIPDDVDEATVTKNIVSKALAEAALEKKYGDEEKDELEEMEVEIPIQYDSDEELECAICDATKNLVQCLGCTGDLYCPTCFAEYHNAMEKHKTVPVKPRKSIPD
ncbi:abscission/NoCut checkpoint regulator isoform X1 [Diachasma alloeum]|uniref:abscission/NoCut checkpoint regulator isoform X1 n=2 Tax=Diachasma alloeum TaxID=454923 RepID=UPI0007381269|nr:abscission/NoCut checkpoint regulator isoform X1 [Diachasma alloeum]